MIVNKKTVGIARHSWKRIVFNGVRTYGIIKSFKYSYICFSFAEEDLDLDWGVV